MLEGCGDFVFGCLEFLFVLGQDFGLGLEEGGEGVEDCGWWGLMGGRGREGRV